MDVVRVCVCSPCVLTRICVQLQAAAVMGTDAHPPVTAAFHKSHSGVQHQPGISPVYLCMCTYAHTVWLTTCLKCGKKMKCQYIGSVTTKWMGSQFEFNHRKHLSCQNNMKSWEQLKCHLRRGGWIQLRCQLKAGQVLIHEPHAVDAGLKLERNFRMNGWEWRGWRGVDKICQSWNIPLRWPLWGSGSSVPTGNNSAPSLLLTVHLLPCRHLLGYVPGLVPFLFFLFCFVYTHPTLLTLLHTIHFVHPPCVFFSCI